ncbi:VOC family protein [bacterium]|nr:VOC family protein [bacterium]
MADEATAKQPEVEVRFFYLLCNDVEAMRGFYTDLLGMQETNYMNEPEMGWLCYAFGDIEFMFFRAENTLPVPDKYASQPGWPGGELEVPSWSVLIPEEDFAATVQALINAGVPTFAAKPMFCLDNYWSFPVLDPMGNTVEVYTIPKVKPENGEWPE